MFLDPYYFPYRARERDVPYDHVLLFQLDETFLKYLRQMQISPF